MRNALADQLYEEAKKDPRIVIITADISPVGSIHKFREEFPDRFINVGVSEQSMIGIAAGLALKGKRPFCYTIANFALYRPFEFIRNDLCYQNLPVTIVGMGAGLSYADHGGSHHTIEDVAIASALPNMTVLAPCDPFETRACVKWCAQEAPGPTYLRLGKHGEPNLEDEKTSNTLLNGMPVSRLLVSHSTPDIILTYGPIASVAVEVGETIAASVVSCLGLKPFCTDFFSNLLDGPSKVIVIEEHVPNGGLSSRIKDIIVSQHKHRVELKCFTLPDKFIHFNGTREDALASVGLSTEKIVKALQAR